MKPAPAFGSTAVVVSEPKSDADNAHLIIDHGMLIMGRPDEPMGTIHAINLDAERALEIASALTEWARRKFAEDHARFELEMAQFGILDA